MYLLDGDFLTALPAIILGMICMGIFCFLVFGLISKATGMSIRYRGGITYRGGTIATPDGLDQVSSAIRKKFDKKYKIKKQVEGELNAAIEMAVGPIDDAIVSIGRQRIMNSHLSSKLKTNPIDYNKKMEELLSLKQRVITEIKVRYENKLNELLSHL